MEKHKCKLCSRKFLNGKALGGHMRSHLMVLPLPPKTLPPVNQDSGESTLSENQEQVLGNYGLRENPKKSFRTIDPEFLEYHVVQDRESETESKKSNKNPTGRRSKRSRKMEKLNKEKPVDFEPLSLFSDRSSEEDVAMCLMMLSRDVWIKQGKYQCGVCYRMFKTTQALGSHKTIHKESQQKPSRKPVGRKNILDEKLQLHECSFCGKKFKTGQALGGHKRSHLLIMSSSTYAGSCSSKLGDSLMECSNSAKLHNGFIDLNMLAPMEDEDYHSLQPDFSEVSNADFQQDQEHERG